jgi:hypothetical protein
MKVVLALVGPALLAGALMLSTTSVVGKTPPDPHLPASAVLWGDRYFESRASLTRWLRARGASYRIWAARHPDAAARHSLPPESNRAPLAQ